MNGNAHFKIGVLTCAIASTVPVINSSIVLNNSYLSIPNGINIAGLLLAGVAALAVDADSQHSKINRMNPVTGIVSEGIEMVEGVLKTIVRLLITFGIALLIFCNSVNITQNLTKLFGQSPWTVVITYGVGVLMLLIGIGNKRILGKVPILGDIYLGIARGLDAVSSLLKRIVMIIVYAGAGIGVCVYNYFHYSEVGMYLVGGLFIAIAIFPHRSFMHSVLEGLPLVTLSAVYVLGKLGFGYLTGAFFIGYASHILLADILTKEGIPLSVIPMIFEKTGLHKRLHNNLLYKVIHGVLDVRLKIPLMSTGTKFGNTFEMVYTLILLAIAVGCYIVFGGTVVLL